MAVLQGCPSWCIQIHCKLEPNTICGRNFRKFVVCGRFFFFFSYSFHSQPKKQKDALEGKGLVLVINLSSANDWLLFDPSLKILNGEELNKLSKKLGDLMEPFLFDQFPVSVIEKYSWIAMVCIPRTTQDLREMGTDQFNYEVNTAMELTTSLGSQPTILCGGELQQKIGNGATFNLQECTIQNDKILEIQQVQECIQKFSIPKSTMWFYNNKSK